MSRQIAISPSLLPVLLDPLGSVSVRCSVVRRGVLLSALSLFPVCCHDSSVLRALSMSARRTRHRPSADPVMNPSPSSPPLGREEPDNTAFYLNHVLPPSRIVRSFPLPLLCLLSVALLGLSFLFLPAVSTWIVWLLVALLRLLAFIICALLFLLWWCQSSLLYMPSFMGRHHLQRSTAHNSPGFVSPAEHNMTYSEEWLLTPDGVTLHAWLLTQPTIPSHHPTLIFFHGNAGNIGFRLPNAKSLYRLCHVNLLMIEYRGYGNSSGTASEEGLRRDAQCALSWLRQHGRSRGVDPDNLFIFGRSLGGAVAFDVVAGGSSAGIRGVIVENTFTSIADMVLVLLARIATAIQRGQAHAMEAEGTELDGGLMERVIRGLLLFFMTSHWDTASRLSAVHCPVLLISGDKDELVPTWQMKRLHDKLRQQGGEVEWLSIAGGQHNDTYMRGVSQGYWQRFAEFVDKHRLKRSEAERGQSHSADHSSTSGMSALSSHASN